ncbi:LexA family protein [Prochlorococcus marinus]|uniref:Peptidase S24 n=1 Tax=Prochlorococcus marinus XMU1408 TaxID=2213228 RepID=A0A318R2H9_PROMR|nr:translesion error-prone DNA polymerase V autoproteolytic subunit [Prochlorococcus marinus]MBW3041904.1 peptidase S24 [Prochlorococcus marinus str. XMU1408]PYE03035.1 peptidase S24 [Prochlorococcus marinus XMU1408]
MYSKISHSSSKEMPSNLLVPLVKETISAGFPSPAEDYIELGIDLNQYLIKNPISTFFLRVCGNSMNNAGIYNNDLLIIDRSINPTPGHVVVALLDGEFTLKRLIKEKNNYYLKADKKNYPAINLYEYLDIQIWGVAIYSIHKLER